ncbi:MAG: GIY-YIG nuclease family protein [bacterium]|nr:GIY-YIG nuclease family protein [bacterium]
MAWVYILKTKSGKYYVGSTENLDERLRHHFGGYTPSTKRLHVQSLALAQQYKSLKDARAVELKIKKLKRKDYIEKMLQDGYIKLSPE